MCRSTVCLDGPDIYQRQAVCRICYASQPVSCTNRHASTSSLPEAIRLSGAHGSQKKVEADARTLRALCRLVRLASVRHLPLTTSSAAVDPRLHHIFCCPFSPYCCYASGMCCNNDGSRIGTCGKLCMSHASALSITFFFFLFRGSERCCVSQAARGTSELLHV